MKYHIEKNSVQETLVIPLFGRLVCSERFPELFSDPAARRICDSLDYDFAEKRKKMESPAGLFGALETDSERLFKGATVYIGDIKIECLLVPGHTWGHMVYLIEDA